MSNAAPSLVPGAVVRALLLLAAAGMAGGCRSGVRIRKVDESVWFSRENRSALDTGQPSERTREFLRREALQDEWRSDPVALIEALHERMLVQRQRAVAAHVAELAFLEAKRHRGSESEEPRFLLTCAEHAWAAVFDPGLAPAPDPYDPAFRLACDLYNRSTAWILKFAAARRGQAPGPRWSVVGGDLVVRLDHSDYDWDPKDYDELVIAWDVEVVGLPRSARTYGIGVPVIISRARPATAGNPTRGTDLVRNVYSSTVLLRFDGSIVERRVERERTARIEVFDPYKTSRVDVAGASVPLEADLSGALAYTLAKSTQGGGLGAVFNPEKYQSLTRLLMLQPYDPAKIPVVFVHGLMSSPVTWAPLLNDLLADPVLRNRYQFWFFRYSTGNPVLYSASMLRAALVENVTRYDPEGANPCLQDMVLVGHSMGGLLSRVQVRASEDRIWKLVSDEPFDVVSKDLAFSEEEATLLRQTVFFDSLPFIRRVVFMAVPHRGSELATGWFAALGMKLITLPVKLTGAITSVAYKASRKVGGHLNVKFLPDADSATGVGNLAPDHRVQKAIADWPFPEGLPIHSLIGNEDGIEPAGSDGLVPYTSSHLDGIASEKVIHSGHDVHVHPEAAIELRRILALHLQEFEASQATQAVPAGAVDGG